MKYIASLLIAFTLLACGSNSETKAPEKSADKKETTQAASKNAVALESIPKERVMKLWEECTLIDYIFHDLPFSMSQDEQVSIRANLNYISVEAQEFIPANCKPIGRQFFQENGDITLEADVYLSEGCQFYVFVENEKPAYANKMNSEGVEFFNTMFSQASGANPNGK